MPLSTLEPTGQQHLYLIFDDWPWGYSIRKLNLPRPPEQRLETRRPEHKRLPPPCICLEATRRHPFFFAAVGTSIIAAHPRNYPLESPFPKFMPIVDVRSLSVRFGPALSGHPKIFITVGDKEVFALGIGVFATLSVKPLYPPGPQELSWCDLPPAPFDNMDVTSFAVGSDGSTIFVSTDCATFAFDIANSEWKQSSNCSLPFAGPTNYVHALDVFVGLSKAPDTYGHLCFCFCRELGGDEDARPSKENLLSKDPAESIGGVTLVYLGGSEPGFCLVERVSITEGKSVNVRLEECDEGGDDCGDLDQLKKNVDEGDVASGSMQELDEQNKFVDNKRDGASGSMHYRYLYRLTTFSLSVLTTTET